MTAVYSPCRFRLDGLDHFVLWYSDDSDGLVRVDGRLLSWSSLASLLEYARSKGMAVQSAEVPLYDWDGVERWCADPAPERLDAVRWLNAWNMAVDAIVPDQESEQFRQANARADALYEKLFRANNLPAMTPAGAEFRPVWTKAETAELARLLRLGVAEIRRQMKG